MIIESKRYHVCWRSKGEDQDHRSVGTWPLEKATLLSEFANANFKMARHWVEADVYSNGDNE